VLGSGVIRQNSDYSLPTLPFRLAESRSGIGAVVCAYKPVEPLQPAGDTRRLREDQRFRVTAVQYRHRSVGRPRHATPRDAMQSAISVPLRRLANAMTSTAETRSGTRGRRKREDNYCGQQ